MRRTSALVLASVGAVIAAAGCGTAGTDKTASKPAPPTPTARHPTPATTEPGRGTVVNVTYRNLAISPANTTVKVGTRIVWTNDDNVAHTVTSVSGPASFNTPRFGKGGTVSFTATQPGVIHYVCNVHPTAMLGTIKVVP